MIDKIIDALTIDKFVSYFNGNLIQIFDNKDYKNNDIEKYKQVDKNKLFEK